MAKLEATHASSQSQSQTHAQDLQERLGRAQEAVKQLEVRRALDQEGWASDVTLLRRQLSAVDRSAQSLSYQLSWVAEYTYDKLQPEYECTTLCNSELTTPNLVKDFD